MISESDGGFLTVPDTVISEIVREVEPDLAEAAVTEAIADAAPTRAQRRRLAHALHERPDLVTSGRPLGPPQIQRLVNALLAAGARRVVASRCGHCQLPKPLTQRDGEIRICGSCDRRRRGRREPCSRCGGVGGVATRDHDGQPICGNCTTYQQHDPVDELLAVLAPLAAGLDRQALTELIHTAIPQRFQHHRVLRELQNLLACSPAREPMAPHGSTR